LCDCYARGDRRVNGSRFVAGVHRPDSPKEKAVDVSTSRDGWLGPAPARPSDPGLHPFYWLWLVDYGHLMLGTWPPSHRPLRGPGLTHPDTIEARPAAQPHQRPGGLGALIPRARREAAVHLTWYHGEPRPYIRRANAPSWQQAPSSSADNGMLLADYDHYKLAAENDFGRLQNPPSAPSPLRRPPQGLSSCQPTSPTLCDFAYSAVSGRSCWAVAFRRGRSGEWDAATNTSRTV